MKKMMMKYSEALNVRGATRVERKKEGESEKQKKLETSE